MDMRVAMRDEARFTAPYLRRVVTDERNGLHGSTPLRVFDNHDRPRSWDRMGDGLHNDDIARAVAAFLYLTPGSALTYYGAELGMRTSVPQRREDVQDPIGISGWPQEKGRDGERTPMQWTPGPQAGFTQGAKSWLPVPDSHVQINVQTETRDPDSLLNWTRQLLQLRHARAALQTGDIRFVDQDDPHVLAFVRETPEGGDTGAVLVAINLSATEQGYAVPDGIFGDAAPIALAISPSVPRSRTPGHWVLPAYGVLVLGGLPSQR
jgi:alpha-glucosidase